jgi:hypothetical protein
LAKFDSKHAPVMGDDIAALIGVGGGETRAAPYTGTKALMLAVLEDAIRAYLSHEPRARAEAEQWVLSRQRRSVFSFAVVCETLGLEPKAVRAAVRRLRADDVSPDRIPRSRPNARRRPTIVRDPGPEE